MSGLEVGLQRRDNPIQAKLAQLTKPEEHPVSTIPTGVASVMATRMDR
jgi:hypothetical protein